MRAMAYSRDGLLRQIERVVPTPGPHEVRVRVGISAVNPADWRNRRGYSGYPDVVPHHDGAGVVDAVGSLVDRSRIGERVWLWGAARQPGGGTAQEWVVVPEANAVPLPSSASLASGACLGVPALTAHRCLTVGEGGPSELGPGTMRDRTILVAGGAGAVGHAAIQLARWSGARVIATVSSGTKAALAEAAGAHHVLDYRAPGLAARVRKLAREGIDIVVEVAPHENAETDAQVLKPGGTVACYAASSAEPFSLSIGPLLGANARWQFVSVFTVPRAATAAGIRAVSAALAAGALPVGETHGLPLHCFALASTGDAHDAVEGGAVGKVLIEVYPEIDDALGDRSSIG